MTTNINNSANNLNELQGIWRLEKYSTFENNGWEDIDAGTKKLYLILQHMHLMLIRDNVMILSVSLPTEVALSAYGKDSIGLGIIEAPGAEMKRFRFKFAKRGYDSASTMAFKCIQILTKIIKLDAMDPNDDSAIEDELYIPDVVSEMLNKDSSILDMASQNDNDFPLEEFIVTCITDVNFPELVCKVNTILQKFSFNKS